MPPSREHHTKRTLLHLTRAIEAVHVADEPSSTIVVALFQERRFFDQSRERYEAWTGDGGPTVIAGFAGHPPYRQRGSLHCVTIHEDAPLAAEWTLVATDGNSAVALVAEDQYTPGVVDHRRRFASRLSFAPPYVADELDRLAGALAGDLRPDLVAHLRAVARTCARLPISDDSGLDEMLRIADEQVMARFRSSVDHTV